MLNKRIKYASYIYNTGKAKIKGNIYILQLFYKTQNSYQWIDSAFMSLCLLQSVEDAIFQNLYSHIIS